MELHRIVNEEFKPVINEWISNNNICKNCDKGDLAWDIIKCICESKLILQDFIDIIKICSDNNIIIEKGNIWDKLKKYFKDNHIIFLQCISNTCPRALSSSPNADCGKFELLYRLLRPNSRQPNKGDIIDIKETFDTEETKEIVEIKGSQIRLFAEITGKQYIKDTNNIFRGKGIIGNTPKIGGLKGTEQFEIEKTQYQLHYNNQFCKNIPKALVLIKEYLHIHDIPYSEIDIEEMFKGNEWHQSVLQKLWLKKMYLLTMKNNGADKMIIFGDGTNVKILDNIDKLSNFKIDTDYFRINQQADVGYYII